MQVIIASNKNMKRKSQCETSSLLIHIQNINLNHFCIIILNEVKCILGYLKQRNIMLFNYFLMLIFVRNRNTMILMTHRQFKEGISCCWLLYPKKITNVSSPQYSVKFHTQKKESSRQYCAILQTEFCRKRQYFKQKT